MLLSVTRKLNVTVPAVGERGVGHGTAGWSSRRVLRTSELKPRGKKGTSMLRSWGKDSNQRNGNCKSCFSARKKARW
jgi:hypothetical protein